MSSHPHPQACVRACKVTNRGEKSTIRIFFYCFVGFFTHDLPGAERRWDLESIRVNIYRLGVAIRCNLLLYILVSKRRFTHARV